MALGKHQSVAVSHIGICGVNIHLFKVEVCQEICDGKRSSGMSGRSRINRVDDPNADPSCDLLQFADSFCIHLCNPFFTRHGASDALPDIFRGVKYRLTFIVIYFCSDVNTVYAYFALLLRLLRF